MKLAIEPYVRGVCGHFADLWLEDPESASNPSVAMLCAQFHLRSKDAKIAVYLPIRPTLETCMHFEFFKSRYPLLYRVSNPIIGGTLTIDLR